MPWPPRPRRRSHPHGTPPQRGPAGLRAPPAAIAALGPRRRPKERARKEIAPPPASAGGPWAFSTGSLRAPRGGEESHRLVHQGVDALNPTSPPRVLVDGDPALIEDQRALDDDRLAIGGVARDLEPGPPEDAAVLLAALGQRLEAPALRSDHADR